MHDVRHTLDLRQANTAARRGAIAGFVAGGITLLVVIVAITTDGSGRFALWNDPWNLLDVALLVGLSAGVLRRSRVAAIGLIVYYVISKIIIYMEVGKIGGLAIPILFLYFFLRAAQGTVVYHRLRRHADQSYRPTRRWVYWLWVPTVPLVLLLVAFIVIGFVGPSTAVLSSEDLKIRDLELLRSRGIVEPNENVLYFYSAGLLSIMEDGNILTDSRVISYETLESELWIASALFEDITHISVEQEGSTFSDTVVTVGTYDGSEFQLLLSVERGGDKRFLDALRARTTEAQLNDRVHR